MQTWEELLETGNGAVEYRLEIEGFRYNFVTHEDLAITSGSFVRLPGLTREGLRIHYETSMTDRVLKAGGMTFNIVDSLDPLSAFDPTFGSDENEDAAITEALSFQTTKQTRLRSRVSLITQTIDVDNATGWSAGDVIHIGTEAIQIGSVYTGAGGPSFLSCVRGYMNTLAQVHEITDMDGISNQVWITDAPLMLERRRCRLYVYGDGDDYTGPGTLIWLGLLSAEKELVDATTWRITARARTEILKEKLTGGFGECAIKGVYHPTRVPFRATVMIAADANLLVAAPDDQFNITVTGFFPTRREFIDEINRQANAGSSGWASRVSAGLDAGGRLTFSFSTNGTAKAIIIQTSGYSVSDGTAPAPFEYIQSQVGDSVYLQTDIASDGSIEDGASAQTAVAANKAYVIFPLHKDATYPNSVTTLYTSDAPDTIVYPGLRLYVDLPTVSTVVNSLLLIGEDDEEIPLRVLSTGVDDGHAYIETEPLTLALYHVSRAELITDESHEIKTGIAFVTAGSVVDFLDELTEMAVSNRQNVPFITTEDIDIEDMRAELVASSPGNHVTRRKYALYESDKTLEQFLAEEFKLAGMIPTIHPTNHKITMRRLRFVGISEPTVATLDHSNILTDRAFPTYVESKEHIRNVCRLKTEYNFAEDEHQGRDYVSRMPSSILHYGASEFTISPISSETILPPDRVAIEAELLRPIAILGAPYAHTSFELPFLEDAWNLYPGSPISLTNAQLPDRLYGTRGIAQKPGYITGVSKDIPNGRIKVEALVALVAYAGYTPTTIIRLATSGANPEDRNLICFNSDVEYTPDTSVPDAQWFNVGDRIRVESMDSWEPNAAEGVITGKSVFVTTTNLQVTFDSEPHGFADFTQTIRPRMRYQHLTGSLLSDNEEQRGWVYLADGTLGPRDDLRYFGA